MFEQVIATIVLMLLGSLLSVLVCHKLKFPLVVAYILVGVIAGPFILNILTNMSLIYAVAEFGLVFLLFSIGLEFSLQRLTHYKISLLALALGQLILTCAITALIGMKIGMNLTQSIIVGTVVAMSSTAVVSKQLKDQNEFTLTHAPFIISILLVQDIAVIPALIFVSSANTATLVNADWLELMLFLGKSFVFIALILLLGKYILKPFFHWIYKQQNAEIFTLATLLVAIGFAWLTHFIGLSWILGGFIAGLLLAETNFRQKIEYELRPFKDILMGLFFIAIGSQLNFSEVILHWPWILLLLSAIILGKFLIVLLLGLLVTKQKPMALRIALCLAQGGEFGFALLVLAFNQGIFSTEYAQVILASLLMSMIVSSFIIRFNEAITHKILGIK